MSELPEGWISIPIGEIIELNPKNEVADDAMGASDWVRGGIQRLHVAQVVEVGCWSKLLPTRKPDEVISVLQRPRVEE